VTRWFRFARLRAILEEGEDETTQTTVRGTIVLLVLLLALTQEFHLDAVLGAFLAGMVLRRWAGAGRPALEAKLDAIGYGFFIPIFFVCSGMAMDLRAMASAPLRVLLFAALMLLVHLVPVFVVYRRALGLRERWQMTLVSSTALPLLVAITEIGRRNGTLLAENAAALVGAGVLTVLVFPAVAVALRRRTPAGPAAVDAPVDGADDVPGRTTPA
jgi:Kef-type K+ transport system membrane component KefB